ncbi:tumor necrosis factor receptor superfamily member 1B isoform X3 [Bubalus bubalis]|uniref:tumor necrosis factor receptor superfamily member 1B isoform X3 n=1 Tax=Bubalus bubalis TaxID=89462 RepID=UPI000DBC5676|nr:tumor necrosis factor receptor superfamily member 1B isoform X3 [Bubalus bubalis]
MLEGGCRVSAGGEWLALEVRTQRRGGQTPVRVRAVVQGGRRGAGAGGGQGGVSAPGPAPPACLGPRTGFRFQSEARRQRSGSGRSRARGVGQPARTYGAHRLLGRAGGRSAVLGRGPRRARPGCVYPLHPRAWKLMPAARILQPQDPDVLQQMSTRPGGNSSLHNKTESHLHLQARLVLHPGEAGGLPAVRGAAQMRPWLRRGQTRNCNNKCDMRSLWPGDILRYNIIHGYLQAPPELQFCGHSWYRIDRCSLHLCAPHPEGGPGPSHHKIPAHGADSGAQHSSKHLLPPPKSPKSSKFPSGTAQHREHLSSHWTDCGCDSVGSATDSCCELCHHDPEKKEALLPARRCQGGLTLQRLITEATENQTS